jgi:hypothetical protein
LIVVHGRLSGQLILPAANFVERPVLFLAVDTTIARFPACAALQKLLSSRLLFAIGAVAYAAIVTIISILRHGRQPKMQFICVVSYECWENSKILKTNATVIFKSTFES